MEMNTNQWFLELGVPSNMIISLLFLSMISILFIQSGLDKVFNWNGELAFYKKHFKDTFLKNTVGLLMPVITISELLAGFLSLIGAIIYLFGGNNSLAILGAFFACLSIIQLFFGQRIAKDYAGSATLVPYFFLAVGGLYFLIN